MLDRLRNARGASCQVLATFIDVRGFSSFAGVAESTDTALYLRSMYSRVLQDFFPDADFFKPTGDGLMIIHKLTDDVEELTETVRDKVTKASELVESFPTITQGDVLINFEVPQHLGVGLARGSATELSDENGDTIDFSGRCLNLAARLMDLARPEGVVFHDRHAKTLLGDQLGKELTAEDVYIRGIAEQTPIEVHCTAKWVELQPSAKTPPQRKKAFDEPRRLSVKKIRELGETHLVALNRRPIEPYNVEVAVEFPKFATDGTKTGTLATFRVPGMVLEEPEGFYARIETALILRHVEKNHVQDGSVMVKLTPYH